MKNELAELVRLTKEYVKDMERSGIAAVDADEADVSLPDRLADFYNEIKLCRKCPLGDTRTNFVFGEGNPSAGLVFVGEAPGYDEDRNGRPFVGRAGRLLDKIINAMGYKREDVYICNVLKCRPPGNRPPQPDEIKRCMPYLEKQLLLLRRKKVICCLGAYSSRTLLGMDMPMKLMRGRWHRYKDTPVMVTYHPAYLLRNPSAKNIVWRDMKMVMGCMRK